MRIAKQTYNHIGIVKRRGRAIKVSLPNVSWKWSVFVGCVAGIVIFFILSYRHALLFFIAMDKVPPLLVPLMYGYAAVGRFYDPTFGPRGEWIIGLIVLWAMALAVPTWRQGLRGLLVSLLQAAVFALVAATGVDLGAYYFQTLDGLYDWDWQLTHSAVYFVLFPAGSVALSVPFLAWRARRLPPGERVKALREGMKLSLIWALFVEGVAMLLGVAGPKFPSAFGFYLWRDLTGLIPFCVLALSLSLSLSLLTGVYFCGTAVSGDPGRVRRLSIVGLLALGLMLPGLVAAYVSREPSGGPAPGLAQTSFVQWIFSHDGITLAESGKIRTGYIEWLTTEAPEPGLWHYRFPGDLMSAMRDKADYRVLRDWYLKKPGLTALGSSIVRQVSDADPRLTTEEARRLLSAFASTVPATLGDSCGFLIMAYRFLPPEEQEAYLQLWRGRVNRVGFIQPRTRWAWEEAPCIDGESLEVMRMDGFSQDRSGLISGRIDVLHDLINTERGASALAVAASPAIREPRSEWDAQYQHVHFVTSKLYPSRIQHTPVGKHGDFIFFGLPERNYGLSLLALEDGFSRPENAALLSWPGELSLTKQGPAVSDADVRVGERLNVSPMKATGFDALELQWKPISGASKYRLQWWRWTDSSRFPCNPSSLSSDRQVEFLATVRPEMRGQVFVVAHPAACYGSVGQWVPLKQSEATTRSTMVEIHVPPGSGVFFPFVVALDAAGKPIASNLSLFPPK